MRSVGKFYRRLADEKFRSAETLVAAENPAQVVNRLAQQKIFVTEKPEGFRVATDFFNNEDDIEHSDTQITQISLNLFV